MPHIVAAPVKSAVCPKAIDRTTCGDRKDRAACFVIVRAAAQKRIIESDVHAAKAIQNRNKPKGKYSGSAEGGYMNGIDDVICRSPV
jgi:hypothetical protein